MKRIMIWENVLLRHAESFEKTKYRSSASMTQRLATDEIGHVGAFYGGQYSLGIDD